MAKTPKPNPLLGPIRDSFKVKRSKQGTIPKSWLLVVLCILDQIKDSDSVLEEDDIYTYDYTLKKSRGGAIRETLRKYSLPENLGMGKEGITTRGASGLRMFRAMKGGTVIMDRPKKERDSLVLEAIKEVREELLKTLGQKPVVLQPHVFRKTGTFISALLKAVKNRSNGRVEQALVGAKLELRYANRAIPEHHSFAGDRQTGRECDFEVDDLRVIVSVAPKDQHFESAIELAKKNRQVVLVVSEKAFNAAKKRIEKDGYKDDVQVFSVGDYVVCNMTEISTDRGVPPREMCLELAKVYNRRIVADNDTSLQVDLPEE